MHALAELFEGDNGKKSILNFNSGRIILFLYVLNGSNFDFDDEEFDVVFRGMYYVLTEDIVMNDVLDYNN